MYLDSSVSLLHFFDRNEWVWLLKLVLNGPSVDP